MTQRKATPKEVLDQLNLIRRHLEALYVRPTRPISKATRERIDKNNLMTLAFAGKWFERHLERFMNEERLSNEQASEIVHFIDEHITINDNGLSLHDCEVVHDDV